MNDNGAGDDTPELTAYHEAGHAVIATYLGGRVLSVSITPESNWEDGPERFGEACVAWQREPEKSLAKKLALVALAGPAAEMLYQGETPHPAFVAEWAQDWQAAENALASLLPERRARVFALEQMTVELRRMLDQSTVWEAVAGLADHLLAHEILEEEMLEEILGNWF